MSERKFKVGDIAYFVPLGVRDFRDKVVVLQVNSTIFGDKWCEVKYVCAADGRNGFFAYESELEEVEPLLSEINRAQTSRKK